MTIEESYKLANESGAEFDAALTDILAGLIEPNSLARRLAVRGGVVSGATWSGLMVGPDATNCPPGWIFINIADALPETVMAALQAIKIPIV